MKHLQIQEVKGMEALEALASVAALEAFSLRAVANRAADIIPSLAHALTEALAVHKGDKYDLKPLSINHIVLKKALASASYLQVTSLNVFIPQGFKGNFSDYTTTLLLAVKFTNGIEARMTKFNQLVSALISDKSTRLSTSDLSTATNSMESEREIVRKALGEFVSPNGSRHNRASLGDVYRSLTEITDVNSKIVDLLEKANELTLLQVKKLADDASELLTVLGEEAAKGTIGELSNESYRSLASATLTMARDVELHSVLMFSVYQAKKAAEDTAAELIQVLRY